MLRQISILCSLQVKNFLGLNEIRYTKDREKRKRYLGMGVAWGLLILILMGYVTAFSIGMTLIGMGEAVPVYLYAVVSIVILFFTSFKAGSILFSMKSFEMLAALPVSRSAIVISRFLDMYVSNLLIGALIMLPGTIIYGIMMQKGVYGFLASIIGTLFLPLLPVTLASILGGFVTALSARWKRKSLAEAGVMLFVVSGIMIGSMMLSGQAEEINLTQIKDLAGMAAGMIGEIYPPALMFSQLLAGKISALGMLVGLPMVVAVIFIWVLQKYFVRICSALNASTAKNDYRMGKLHAGSVVKALWKKELRRYFASSGYVTNTIVGYVLAVLLAASLCFTGVEQMEVTMEIPGFAKYAASVVPFILACTFSISSSTSCAVSMEGKMFWQLQTLPIRSIDIYNSKILANLTISLPFYAIVEIMVIVTLKPKFGQLILLMAIPLSYICFIAVCGIFINLHFPAMSWDNEVKVVKQSASVMLTMLVGCVTSLVPVGAIILLGYSRTGVISVGMILLLVLATTILYDKMKKIELIQIA